VLLDIKVDFFSRARARISSRLAIHFPTEMIPKQGAKSAFPRAGARPQSLPTAVQEQLLDIKVYFFSRACARINSMLAIHVPTKMIPK
jgi:hypothetical protein